MQFTYCCMLISAFFCINVIADADLIDLTVLNDTYDYFTTAILDQYVDYIIHVHYDSDTSSDLNTFFNSKTRTLMHLATNYDSEEYFKIPLHSMEPKMYNDVTREDGYKVLNLIYLIDLQRFETFSNVTYNIMPDDVMLFVYKNDTYNIDDQFWLMNGTDKGCGLILFDIQLKDLHYCHFFVGNASGNAVKIDADYVNISSASEFSGPPVLLQYNNLFQDFNQHEVLVGYTSHTPFTWCKNITVDTDERVCYMAGVEGDILLDLGKRFNISVYVINYDNETLDGHSLLIEDVRINKLDWAIGGITLTYSRYHEADFGAPLRVESYVALISIPRGTNLKWGYIIGPFTLSVWFTLFALMLLHSTSLKVIYYALQSPQSLSNWAYFMTPIKSFLSVSENRVRATNLSLKLTYGFIWFTVGIIVSTAYKSKLTSLMIKPIIWQPQTIEELLDNHYSFQLMKKEWRVLREGADQMEDQKASMYSEVLMLAKDDLSYCDAVKIVLKRRIALLQEETPMQYQVINTCGDELTQKEYQLLRIVNERIFPNNHAWPMQLAAPYVEAFYMYFQRLQANGIIPYLYKKYDIKKHIPKTNEAVNTKFLPIVKIQNLSDPLMVLLLGYLLASIILTVELCTHRYRNCK